MGKFDMMFKYFAPPVAALALTALGASASPVDLSPISPSVAPVQSVPEVTIEGVDSGVGELSGFINVVPTDINGETEITFGSASYEFFNGTVVSGDVTFATNMNLSFTTPSTNVSLTIVDVQPGSPTTSFDEVMITAFDAASFALGSITVTSGDGGIDDLFNSTPDANGIYTRLLDFSSFGAISSLSFDDKAASPFVTGGFLYFGIEATPVPLPASLPLLIAGAGLFGAVRLRQRKKD